jgi:surface protein
MLRLQHVLKSSRAALDLVSIMVGIIVIGLIGGVIAATIFAVIPWAQDNAARQQLSSIHTAENALYGLSAAPDAEMKGGVGSSTFTNSAGLDANGLLVQNPKKYCVVATGDGQDYNAYSRSDSGKIFTASNYKKNAVITTSAPCLSDTGSGVGGDGSDGNGTGTNPGTGTGTGGTGTGTTPTDGSGTGTGTTPTDGSSTGNTGPAPVVSDLMKFTINCPAGVTKVGLPLYQPRGTVTWNDGRVENYGADGRVIDTPGGTSYYNLDYATVRTVTPGTTYTAVLKGTVKQMLNNLNADSMNGSTCIRSVDEWGTKLGLTSISLNNASNLVSVPTSIPPSVTSLNQAFQNATNFKQDVSTWNTANITDMGSAFYGTQNNSDVSKWNVSNVTNMSNMFNGNTAFNQPIGNWDTTNVTNMGSMFMGTSFNQPINSWNTAKVTNMSYMFANSAFNQPIGNWSTVKVTTMSSMFSNAYSFNQLLNDWVMTANGNTSNMFFNAKAFNQPLNKWDVSNVLTTESMFTGAASFNQDISGWNTGNVLKMSYMFKDASTFSQNLSGWRVSNVQYQGHQNFELGSALTPDQYPKFVR